MFLSKKVSRKILLIFGLLITLGLFQNCTSSNTPVESSPTTPGGDPHQEQGEVVTPKGSRQLGFDILSTTPSASFENNVESVKEAGGSYMILGLGWSEIESTTPGDCDLPGTYVDPGGALAAFNSLLPGVGLKLSLSILPISTNINLMPSNLKMKTLDDPLVVCRFQKMLSFVFSKIPNVQLISMQFGNEIDAYSDSNQVPFWGQFWGFFVQASNTAKALRSGVKTSVVSSLYGATGRSSNSIAQGGLSELYKSADMVVVTYYPINDDFTAKNPSVIESEIGALVDRYPNKEIYFNEIGFPSGSSFNSSSEELQKEFVQQVFKTWDKYSEKIPNISFLRMSDLSLAAAQETAALYGLAGNNGFIEFLQTLGLKNTYSGQVKKAYSEILIETKKRQW